MTERRTGRRRERVDQPVGREALRRKPSGGVGECDGAERDDGGDHDQRSKDGAGCRLEGLGQAESPSNALPHRNQHNTNQTSRYARTLRSAELVGALCDA